MASALQNVKNELVHSESRQSWMEQIAEVTELQPHDFSCFCFFRVLGIGKVTSWRNLKDYLAQCWGWASLAFLSPLVPSLAPERVWTLTNSICLAHWDFFLFFPHCPAPPYLSHLQASPGAGEELHEATCLSALQVGRLTHPAQPKPDLALEAVIGRGQRDSLSGIQTPGPKISNRTHFS